VAAIWSELLHRASISTTDNFFELGGHSLMATQVISRIRQHFRVELAMRIIFESPTVQGVSQAVDSARQLGGDKDEDEDSAIVPVSRDAYFVRPVNEPIPATRVPVVGGGDQPRPDMGYRAPGAQSLACGALSQRRAD